MDFLAWSLRNFKRAYLKDNFKEREMIAETSRQAYKKIKPFLNGKRKQIYELFKAHPNGATRQEIARWYMLKECGVCGRVNELIAESYLRVVGTKKDEISGHSAEILKAIERIA